MKLTFKFLLNKKQYPGRDLHPENNGKSHSPNVINIDLDSDRSRNPLVKNITLGELTDSIIQKDYGPNPFMPLRSAYMQNYRPEQTEVWKMNRRLSQKDGIQQPSPQQPPTSQQLQLPTSAPQLIMAHNQNKNSMQSNTGPGRSTPDDRHNSIIRMAQSSSPRAKPYHESITPPDNYHYQASLAHARIQAPPVPTSGHQFALDCYVKNRIVEAMRTEDDKRGDDLHDQQRRTPQQSQTSSSVHHKEMDRGSPPEMVIDDDAQSTRPASGATGSSASSDHPGK